MKILLIAKFSIIEPLGIMFLAQSLLNNGHDVSLFLLRDNESNLINQIKQSKYDFVGLSTYTGFHKTMFKLADELRNLTKVIIGGPHATFFSDSCLSHSDYVVKGEAIKSILNVFDQNKNEKIIFNPNLLSSNEIPKPNRELLYQISSFHQENKIKNVISSFGCPYRCTYCYNDSYNKIYNNYKVRYRLTNSIIDECEELIRYKTELIFFEDDCFGADLNWLKQFLCEYRAKIKLPFHCQLRPEMVTRERISLLADSYCHGVTLAIETSNNDVRRNILKRNYSNDDIYNSCKLIKEFNLKLRTEQMLGLPQTTLEDELNLLKMNTEIKPEIAWTSIFTPYLGTTLGDSCKENNLYLNSNDDIEENFFSNSKLLFNSQRVEQTNMLQKIFSTCSNFSQGNKLAKSFLSSNDYSFNSWFSCMKTHLYDNCLYKV